MIPSIPHRAFFKPGASPYNKLPILNLTRVQPDSLPTEECSQVLSNRTLAPRWGLVQSDSSPASQYVQMQIWVSEPDYKIIDIRVGPVLEDFFRATVLTQSMPLREGLGKDSLQPGRVVLDPQFLVKLRDALLSPRAKRVVPLFILDTGWPDSTTQVHSLDALWGLSERGRKLLHLPARRRPKFPRFVKPNNEHCIRISEALRDLESLDALERVRVMFVPTSKEQGGEEILTELIFLDRIMELKGDAAANAGSELPDTMPVDRKVLDSVNAGAALLVETFPSRIGGGTFVTNKALLNALIWVANRLAAEDSTLFFISESWTVTKNAIRYVPPNPSWGFQIVAAGNSPEINILDESKNHDFARRSIPAQEFVAVLTMDRLGAPRCGSSSVSVGMLDQVLAVGYDGWLDSAECGTSFATPRVAWFLAANEVLRDKPLDPRLRGGTLLRRLLDVKTRHQVADLLFDPSAFIEIHH